MVVISIIIASIKIRLIKALLMENTSISLLASVHKYLDSVRLSRSENTARTYTNAMQSFLGSWMKDGRDPEDDLVSEITEDFIGDFAKDLKSYSPNTEQLYLTAATGYFEYLAAEKLAEINLPRLKMLIKRRARRTGQRLPQFPKGDIQKVLDYAQSLSMLPAETKRQRLQHLRDRAFIITLADTGLRVHEACNLRRGDLDWQEGKAIIIGKGNQQAIVRFSSRSLTALRDYINSRAEVDGAYGRSLSSLPIFARHDLGAGKRVEPISTTTGRNIINLRVKEALGEKAQGTITPHSFRHYFVTEVLQGSGGNIKLAQKLARHKNIQVTQRYAHLSDDELDKGYYDIFED